MDFSEWKELKKGEKTELKIDAAGNEIFAYPRVEARKYINENFYCEWVNGQKGEIIIWK